MSTAAAKDDGDLLARAAAFMAAARALGSTSEEVKLVCERIAAEFKQVRTEFPNSAELTARLKTLEDSVQALADNQAQIVNALAKLGGQSQPF